MKPGKSSLYLLMPVMMYLLYSCNKQEPGVYIIDQYKKNYSYKPGTYWVFFDDISNHVDSLYVTDYVDNAPYSGPNGNGNRYEDILLHLRHFDVTQNQQLGIWSIELGSPYSFDIFARDSFCAFNSSVFYGYPISTGNWNERYQITYLNNFSDNITTYTDVYKIRAMNDSSNNFIYFNNAYGFIKMTLNQGTFNRSLHLLRHNIII